MCWEVGGEEACGGPSGPAGHARDRVDSLGEVCVDRGEPGGRGFWAGEGVGGYFPDQGVELESAHSR